MRKTRPRCDFAAFLNVVTAISSNTCNEKGDSSQQQVGKRTLGAVTRDTLTVVHDPFTVGNWRGPFGRTFPEINLWWEISIVTSKRRKKPPNKFDVANS